MPRKRAVAGGADRPSKDGEGAQPERQVARPESVLEIRVFPGTIEVNEYYSEGWSEALAKALAASGVRTSRRFASRCG
ncbi:MAG: hypothetical protein ACYC6I_06785 [Bacillota bacterium]